MFKCTVCQKLHKTNVQYCDCGNDEFEEIIENSLHSGVKLDPKQLLSYGIFAGCLALSGWVLFGTNPPQTHSKQVNPQAKTVEQIKEIPAIDKIWDDTPAYSYSRESKIGIYKSSVQNALYSNIEDLQSLEDGRCRIEFRINKHGKLTNRRLYKEKGGNLFNNTVIRMMKRTVAVDIPPNGYENAKFSADVYTKDGFIKVELK